jgi:serine/threonine-protein kinase
MQAWLKLLEIPTVLTPPPVLPVHRQKVVRPSANQTFRQLSRTASTRKARTIPWVRLTVIAGYYLVIGFLVGVWSMFWAGAGVMTGAVAVVDADNVADVLITAVVVTVVSAVVSAVVSVGAGFGAVYVAWTVTLAVALLSGLVAGKKLQESFNKFHTFLILLGTSWLGLGLGWLLGSIFR